MDPRVLKTDEQYEAALEVVEELVARQPPRGSEEADRLELFSLLVEQYEQKHHDLGLPTAVEAIKFRMDQQGLTQRDLIPYLGSRAKVSEVLSGKRPLTLSMIRALHAGLGIPADVLLQKPGAALPEEPDLDPRRFPLSEMAKRGYFGGVVRSIQDHAEELVGTFLSAVDTRQLNAAALCRRSRNVRSAKGMDEYALMAWCVRVLGIASAQRLSTPYRDGVITDDFLREVTRLSCLDQGPAVARDYLAKHGIALVIEPHLPRTHLDGAAILDQEKRPVIGMTLRHDRLDNFWFTLLHELVHVRLHLRDPNSPFVDDLDYLDSDDPQELEADRLARDALVPRSARLKTTRAYLQKTPDAVRELASKLGVHPAVVAGRIRYDARNYRLLSRMVGSKEVRVLFEEVQWPR